MHSSRALAGLLTSVSSYEMHDLLDHKKSSIIFSKNFRRFRCFTYVCLYFILGYNKATVNASICQYVLFSVLLLVYCIVYFPEQIKLLID